MENLSIGLLVSSTKPNNIHKACVYICSFYNLKFFYFTPEDMDYENKKINGYIFDGIEWNKEKQDYPQMIYDRLRRRTNVKYIDLYNELNECVFNVKKESVISKLDVYNKFKDEEFCIPFIEINTIQDVIEFLDEYKKIILKPVIGKQGDGIFSLERQGSKYNICGRNTRKILTYDELGKYINGKKYLSQVFAESKTRDNSPFDIRIQVMKNYKNQWEVVKILPKVGLYDKEIVAIPKYGGTWGVWDGFAKHNFGKNSFEILDKKVRETSIDICNKFESMFDEEIPELALDICLDKNMNIHLLEINNAVPGISYCEFEAVEKSIEYLIYKFEKGC